MSGLESVLVSVTFTCMSIRLERISRGKFREKGKKRKKEKGVTAV